MARLFPCACLMQTHHASSDVVFSRMSSTLDKKYGRESISVTSKFSMIKNLFCPCIKERKLSGALISNVSVAKRWRLELENTAYLIFSEARDRHLRMQQRTNGVRKLCILVKRMKKETIAIRDEDVLLLIRCCLHSGHYFIQKINSGENLVQNLLHLAHLCYTESIKYLPRHQNRMIAVGVLRFLQEDERWNSCDFGVKVLRVLMNERGRIHGENIEAEIFLTFVTELAPYCPKLNVRVPSFERTASTMNFQFSRKGSTDLDALTQRNPILEMARVLHGLLANYEFKDFGGDGWVAFDILLTIYIKIVNASTSENYEEEKNRYGFFNMKRESKEWDMTESAIRGCIRNFVDDVLASDLRFTQCRKPQTNYYMEVEDGDEDPPENRKNNSIEMYDFDWDNASQSLISVLRRTIDDDISTDAQYQLLDIIVTATRVPLGFRFLRDCLPETLLSLTLRVAKLGDSGANLRSLKLLQHIVDRHSVRFHVSIPRIYKRDINFTNIQSKDDDLDYFRLYRKEVYDTFYRNFLTHSSILINLEALFCTICLILIELKFPLIARDIAELMVNIQNAIMGMPDLPIQSPRVSAWIHSTVASVLSFIASLHGLNDLEIYVSEIVNRRSEVAPFLIPPLKAKHTIGDITDFEEDLFFNRALVRRGLANSCFDHQKLRAEKAKDIPTIVLSTEKAN